MQESPQWRTMSDNKPDLKLFCVTYKLYKLFPVQLDGQWPRVSIFAIITHHTMTIIYSTTAGEYVCDAEI